MGVENIGARLVNSREGKVVFEKPQMVSTAGLRAGGDPELRKEPCLAPPPKPLQFAF